MNELDGTQLDSFALIGRKPGTEANVRSLLSETKQQVDMPDIINEAWVRKRTDTELANLILLASTEMTKRQSKPTQRIATASSLTNFKEVSEVPLEDYQMVPAGLGPDELARAQTWYIVLISSNPNHEPLSLKIVGDAVLGRRASDNGPEIDLTPFDAGQYGVSRIHALLRPKVDQLILSDLGSTNGTQLNGEKLVLGRFASLIDQSIITIGQLHIKVRIVCRPEDNSSHSLLK